MSTALALVRDADRDRSSDRLLTVPATRDDLISSLTAAGDLLRATGWQLAAIVWAWTYAGTNQWDSASRDVVKLSTIEFSRLKIRGLGSQDSVRRYRRAWQEAMDAGIACSVEPGDIDVQLPDETLWAFDGDGHLVDLSAPEPDSGFSPGTSPTPKPDDEPERDEPEDDGPGPGSRRRPGPPTLGDIQKTREGVFKAIEILSDIRHYNEDLSDAALTALMLIRDEIDLTLKGAN